MKEYLEKLNDSQKKAVKTTEGYIRVIAGAGSGKTRTLTSRFAYLVDELGINPSNILCVTFTNKAAAEMKSRIKKMIPKGNFELICTFHSLCVKIIRRNPEVILYPKDFTIIDKTDAKAILKKIYDDKGIKATELKYSDALNAIEKRKTEDRTYIKYIVKACDKKLMQIYSSAKEISDIIFYGYLYEQKKIHGLDFNDLMLAAMCIIRNNNKVKDYWYSRLEYIMVDEFQDVNELQQGLCEWLSSKHKNLFIVGDPDQTIYSWRGADIKYILDFDKKHPDCSTIFLNENYRSTPEILNLANDLIKNNETRLSKDLIPTRKKGEKGTYKHFETSKDEAEWIANKIKEMQKAGISFSDITILYRASFVSRSIEEQLRKQNIPYIIYSGLSFYEKAEIKDILSYLRMLVSADNISFRRTINSPSRLFGPKKIQAVAEYAEKHNLTEYEALKKSFKENPNLYKGAKVKEYIELIEKFKVKRRLLSITDLVKEILVDSGYESELKKSGDDERLDNLTELTNSIKSYEDDNFGHAELGQYLADISLYTTMEDPEGKDKDNSKVKLMTIHAAKGMEFPHVFVCGMSEGIFPSKKTKNRDAMEEERRLAYVAFTRAKDTLTLTDSEGLGYNGSFEYPSRFILQLDKKLIKYESALPKYYLKDALRFIKENDSFRYYNNYFEDEEIDFKEHDTVTHKVFGEGTVVSVDCKDKTIVVDFKKSDTRTFSLDHTDVLKKI